MKRLLSKHLPQNLYNISRIGYNFSHHIPLYVNYRKYHKFYIPNMKKINVVEYNTNRYDDKFPYFAMFSMFFIWCIALKMILNWAFE